jgi:hypothetical protein
LDYTHVETSDINDVNYISESFITRYQFRFKKKSSGLWGSILKGALIAAAVVTVAAAVVFTCGAAGVAVGAGATVAGAVSAGVGAITGAAGTIAGAVGLGLTGVAAAGAIAGAAVVGTAATIATLGAIQEVRYISSRTFSKKELKGRNTRCPSGYKIVETDESRLIKHDFYDRLIIKDPSKVKVQAILCPDYEVN